MLVPAAAPQQGTTRHIAKNHMQLRRLEPLSENCAALCLNAQKKNVFGRSLFYAGYGRTATDLSRSRRTLPVLCDPGHSLPTYVQPFQTETGSQRPDRRPLPPRPSSRIKVFGKDGGMQGGKGEPFSKKVSLPPCKNKQQTTPAYTLKKRSRSALLTTEKDDRAMAVPAIMGESMGPPKTCSSPAATGRPSRL